MNTEPSLTQQPIPRHVIAGITCGVLALVLTLAAIAYYWLIGADALPEPPRGLSPIWAMAIVLPAMVPIGLWCAHVAARPLHQRLERQENQFDAMQAQHEAELAEIRELRADLRALREAILNEGDQISAVALTQFEKHLNEGGTTVAHLPRVRPGM